jgi:uncharacterized protein (TIGR00297 family)
MLYAALGAPVLLLAMVAALAEAAADTVSSECGQALSGNARLITTFERVPAGTDGGITFGGTLSGGLAATLVSAVSVFAGILPSRLLWIAMLAGVLGMLIDSLLGALCERRGWLGNDTVNFTSTAFAAVIATAFAHLLS